MLAPSSLSLGTLGASNTDLNMTRQTNNNPTADQPQANPYFGTFAFFQPRQAIANKNVKEQKFTSRTATAQVLSTGSVLTYSVSIIKLYYLKVEKAKI